MVSARIEAFGSGSFGPLVDALTHACTAAPQPPGCVLDAGAGPGQYLAAVLAGLPARDGVACDVSVAAARRAAPTLAGHAVVVGDLWRTIPVHTASAALLLNVFAPRNVDEFARVLHPDGRLVVVTPEGDHLHELVRAVGLVSVDPTKRERLHRGLGTRFTVVDETSLSWSRTLAPQVMRSLVMMGPSAHHVDETEVLERIGQVPAQVTFSVRVGVYELAG